jgi:hypothetical protein
MPQTLGPIDELRINIERLRSMLENLIVRGLRACGREELVQLESYAEDLDRSGAGHVASILTELRQQIERNDRAAARTLLSAQTSARLLERLLTLRVVKGTLQQALQRDADPVGDETEEDDSGK